MKTLVIAYLGAIATLLAADGIWLGLVARTFYKEQLGEMMLPSPNFGIAALFYLFFAGGIVLFAVHPSLKAQSPGMALLYGAILGLLAFGTYDISNLATLKNWPVKMSVVDMAWGAFVTALSASGSYYAVLLAGKMGGQTPI